MRVLQVGDMAGVGYKLHRLLSAAPGIEAELLVCAPTTRSYPEARDRGVRRLPYRGRWSNLQLLRQLRAARGAFDIYHGHSLMAPLLQLTCKPFVAHFHGSDIREAAVARTPMGMALRRSLAAAAQVIHCTLDLGPKLRDLGVDAQRMTWLPNPIDTDRFAPAPAERDLRGGCAAVVLHPQPLVEVRRGRVFFEGFVRLARRRRDLRLCWIAHPVTEDQNRELRRLFADAGVTAQVQELEPVDPGEMAALFGAADIVADWFNADLPAVSQTALEAMACGRAVVMSLPRDPADYLHESGAQPGGSAEEVEASLEKLLDAPQLRQELGRQGRAWVLKHHGFSSVRERLLGVYESMRDER